MTENGADTNSASKADPAVIDGDVLTWKCHPAKRSKPKTLGVVAIMHALMFFTIWYTQSVFIGAVVMMAMTLSLGAYFFPTWYTMDAEGVTVKTLITKFKRPWSMFRSHWVDKNGVLLSPFPHASRLENFRGLFVRYERNRPEVVEFVKRFVAEPEEL